jgi:cGMP-dependent protein kinase
LSKIANCLEVDAFKEGEHIIREGAIGNTFYIISKGEVVVTQMLAGCKEPVVSYVYEMKRSTYIHKCIK